MGPHWLVLKESQSAPTTSVAAPPGGPDSLVGGLVHMVRTVRLLTDPAGVASLLGLGLLQFLGLQALWMALMVVTSVARRRRSVGEEPGPAEGLGWGPAEGTGWGWVLQ
jgi:hypothetical protein